MQTWIQGAQLIPQLPNPKTALMHIGIVKQNHSSPGELGQPGFKIMPDGLIGMESINMQQVNRALAEMGYGFVERHPQQPRDALVMAVVVFGEFVEHGRIIVACVLVPLPGVHCKALGV